MCIRDRYDGADVYINASGMVPALDRQFTDELKKAKPYMIMAEYEVKNLSLIHIEMCIRDRKKSYKNRLREAITQGDTMKMCIRDRWNRMLCIRWFMTV